jgi:hypothetical protein
MSHVLYSWTKEHSTWIMVGCAHHRLWYKGKVKGKSHFISWTTAICSRDKHHQSSSTHSQHMIKDISFPSLLTLFWNENTSLHMPSNTIPRTKKGWCKVYLTCSCISLHRYVMLVLWSDESEHHSRFSLHTIKIAVTIFWSFRFLHK